MKANPILLQMKYARVIDLFAQKANISKEEALDFFYSSVTYQLMSKGIADSHCLSDDYLAEDLVMELARRKNSIEMKLDEADKQAAMTKERLSHKAVFDK